MMAAVAAGRGVATELEERTKAAKRVLVRVRRPNMLKIGLGWGRKDRRAD